jgi:hypothetical protein
VDLLGGLAYAELSAFDRLAEDARMAPSLAGRVEMSAMAATEMSHHRRLAEQLVALGVDPAAAMEPFVAPLETFHALTAPSTWLESVVKAYVGDGMADDFYREIAAFVDEPVRGLIRSVLGDAGRAEFARREVEAAVRAEPGVADRLALWARRLVGEAISQTQHVLAERDALMLLMISGTGGLAGVGEMIARLTARHEERMASLGLGS